MRISLNKLLLLIFALFMCLLLFLTYALSKLERTDPDFFHLLEIPVINNGEDMIYPLNFEEIKTYLLIGELVTTDGLLVKDNNFIYSGRISLQNISGETIFSKEFGRKKGIDFRSEILAIIEKSTIENTNQLTLSDYQFTLSDEFLNAQYSEIEFLPQRKFQNALPSETKFRLFLRPNDNLLH